MENKNGRFELQSDLLNMYMAFLKKDHGTVKLDDVEIDGLYNTLENFEKYVDKFLRDYIAFSIKHRGKSEEELLDELLDSIRKALENR